MKRNVFTRLVGPLLAFLLLTSAAFAGAYQNFRAAVYVRAYEVQKMADPEWLKTNWGIIEKQLKVDKVYLEVHRDLIIIDAKTLASAKAFFEAKGIKVSGGIATVRNESNLFETFDYSDPAHLEKMREIIRATASAFDEFIIDDFFFTSAKTESAIKAKGNRTWTEFRLEMMTDVSKNVILKTAREVNPKIRVIIKYPNWYEHFQGMGYNLETQPPIFDAIYTGTETRDSVYNPQHLQPYHSYNQVRYFENIKPGKNDGGWVDTGNRLVADRYAEQLWLTLFAKAPEIMLFAMHELLEPLKKEDRAPWQGQDTSFDYAATAKSIDGLKEITLARAASTSLETVDRYLGKLGKPVGIASYRPYHSRGEDFLHNYLGMIGLPIDLRPDYPQDAQTILLTADAAADKKLVSKIEASLREGKTVAITTGLLARIQENGFEKLFDLSVGTDKTLTDEFWGWRVGKHKLDDKILLPILHYNTNDSWALISTMSHGLGFPVLHFASYGKGVLYVLAIPDNFADLYLYPAETLNAIRAAFSKEQPAVLNGPSRVILMNYDNGSCVVESLRDEAVDVEVVLNNAVKSLRNETANEAVEAKERDGKSVFSVRVKPHSFVVLTTK